MNIESKIDWMQCSIKRSLTGSPFKKIGSMEKSSIGRYKTMNALQFGGKLYQSYDEEQGDMIIMTGDDCHYWRTHMTDEKLIQAVSNYAHNLTRIDYAFDLYNVDFNVRDELKRVADGGLFHTRSKVSLFDSYDEGATVYVGSKKSDSFVRIYDKGSEQGSPEMNWMRIEIQLRRRQAKQFLHDAIAGELSKVARGYLIRKFGIADADWWAEFIKSDEVIQPSPLGRPQSAYMNWLWTTVLPSVVKKSRDISYSKEIAAFVDELYDRCALD